LKISSRSLVITGGAHGHGSLAVIRGERALLSAWLEQGRDWLMFQGRVDLVLQVFFPKFENNFEAGFSRVDVHGLFTSRSPLEKSVT
jgi:hypothetical protein